MNTTAGGRIGGRHIHKVVIGHIQLVSQVVSQVAKDNWARTNSGVTEGRGSVGWKIRGDVFRLCSHFL